MNIDDNKALWRIDEWFLDIEPQKRELLKAFREELLRFNHAINLVSVKSLPLLDLLHFSDSILASRIIAESTKIDEIHDIGSGNGFPGIVFAILYPEIKVNLVEVDQRKAEFLKHVAAQLKLSNIKVLTQSFESLPAESVRFGVSRGFASVSKSIMSGRRVFSESGVYFHLKSEGWASEIAAIPVQLCSYWTPGLVKEYQLPVGDVHFAVVKTTKTSN